MQTTSITPTELDALGQAIRCTRTRQNLSTADLACALGIARERLQAIADGLEDPGFKLTRAIAAALGISSSALLADAEALG
jgi:transcriptional regulator with XRE-family HTH domain